MKNEEEKSPLKDSTLKVFLKHPFELFNHKQIASRLGLYDKSARKEVQQAMQALAKSKVIIEEKRGKYKINSQNLDEDLFPKNYVVGILDMKQTGKAYLMPEDESMEDIFISSADTSNALHGDRVKVMLFPARKTRKKEGKVVEVLKRAKTRFVGTLSIQERYAIMIPDSKHMNVDILVPIEDIGTARNGDKVIVEIIEWHERVRNPIGHVVRVLGKPGTNEVEILSILAEYDFPIDFPEEVIKQVELISGTISGKELEKRKDFRDVCTFTIDPSDAKDFDDAISYRLLENGNAEIGVHIADVSYYVTPGDQIDEEAYRRATSVYLVDRTIPMLPERLSNVLCSLRPHEEKLCFSAVFEMNKQADVIQQWIGRTVICSDHRFTYEEAQKVLETGEGLFCSELKSVYELSAILKENRYKYGSINFESKEVKFILDEQSKPIGVYVKEQKEANFLVEEFMLLANRRVAEFIGKKRDKEKERSFVYRIHDEPNPEKLATFVQFVQKLGYKMSVSSRKGLAKSFNNLFKEIEGKGEENMIDTIAIRTMQKAYYSTQNIGHYGLAFPFYTHFTSPIRRYPDLMVHRLLGRYLEGGSSVEQDILEEKCKHSSLMEKKAAEAERTSVKYKQVEFLSNKIGQVFSGKISGVSKWGIYVELDENKCEGMIRLENLKGDYYYLDEDNYQVVGRRYGKVYKLGSPICIRVLQVDLQKKQMDFEYIDMDSSADDNGSDSKARKEQRQEKDVSLPSRGSKRTNRSSKKK